MKFINFSASYSLSLFSFYSLYTFRRTSIEMRHLETCGRLEWTLTGHASIDNWILYSGTFSRTLSTFPYVKMNFKLSHLISYRLCRFFFVWKEGAGPFAQIFVPTICPHLNPFSFAINKNHFTTLKGMINSSTFTNPPLSCWSKLFP